MMSPVGGNQVTCRKVLDRTFEFFLKQADRNTKFAKYLRHTTNDVLEEISRHKSLL